VVHVLIEKESMKRTSPKRLQLKVETVRTLQQAELEQVVGGFKGRSGAVACTYTVDPCYQGQG
jgi:hypothetical protein